MLRSCLAVLLVVGAVLAAPVPKELKKENAADAVRIVGTWTMTRCNVSGKEMPDPSWRTLTADADGTIKASHQGKPVFEYATTLDPTAAPKRMPWRDKGIGGGVEYECVYAFTAAGLTIVVPHDHKRLPASVEPGPKVTVYEFKRADAK